MDQTPLELGFKDVVFWMKKGEFNEYSKRNIRFNNIYSIEYISGSIMAYKDDSNISLSKIDGYEVIIKHYV